jgi:hypothetical protein
MNYLFSFVLFIFIFFKLYKKNIKEKYKHKAPITRKIGSALYHLPSTAAYGIGKGAEFLYNKGKEIIK